MTFVTRCWWCSRVGLVSVEWLSASLKSTASYPKPGSSLPSTPSSKTMSRSCAGNVSRRLLLWNQPMEPWATGKLEMSPKRSSSFCFLSLNTGVPAVWCGPRQFSKLACPCKHHEWDNKAHWLLCFWTCDWWEVAGNVSSAARTTCKSVWIQTVEQMAL